MARRQGISQCQPRPHHAGDRGLIAPASNRLHRYLSGSLARPIGYDRRDRRGDAHAVQAGKDSRHRRKQFFGRPDGRGFAAWRRCMCCSRPTICSSAKSRPISCPIAARTKSRHSATAHYAAVSSRGGCELIRLSMVTIFRRTDPKFCCLGSRNICRRATARSARAAALRQARYSPGDPLDARSRHHHGAVGRAPSRSTAAG